MNRTVLLLIMATISVATWPGAPTAIAAATEKSAESMAWIQLPGQANDLSVATDGTTFAVDLQGRVWLRPPGAETAWRSLPGTFRRISAANDKLAWAVDERGELYRYNGTWWRSAKDRYSIDAMDVAVSGSGAAYAVSTGGELFALDATRGALAIAGAPPKLQRIVVDDRNQVWVVAGDARLHRFDGRRWSAFKTVRVRELDAGNGGLWVIGDGDELLSLNSDGEVLRRVATRAAAIAVAPGGLPWIVTADGHIHANNPNTGGHTAPPVDEREQVFTQLINWQPVIGSARQLAISGKGAVLALGDTGSVWQWKSRNNWGRLPGSFSRIALDDQNTPWGIDSSGKIFRFQGTFWTEQPGRARDIAAGADGSLWTLPVEGAPARWIAGSRAWRPLGVVPSGGARRIAVAPDGKPWVVTGDGEVSRYDGRQWVDLPAPKASDIAIGPEGSVFITSADQRLWRWDGAGRRWEKLNGEAASVAVGPRGRPWVTTASFRILASAFFDELPDSQVDTVSVAAASAAANANPGTSTMASVVGQPSAGSGAPKGRLDEPLQYRSVAATARDISIGADGSVFIVAYTDGGLARWSNGRNAFVSFPGIFTRIAVTPDGKPWGITTKGEVFRNDGTLWHLVRNIVAQDIAIAYNGTVMVSDKQNALWKYDPASGLFNRVVADGDTPPPTGERLALSPGGKPWTLDANGYVSRCDRDPCERLPARARDIGIGPEGSVIILGTDRILRRWNESAGEFQRMDSIADPVEALAVGPRGKPWLLSIGAQVWASEFFPRDESRDGIEAAATAATSSAQGSNTTTPPVFTFLLNMPFDQLSLPAGFTAGSFPEPRMAINAGGSVVILDSTFKFWNYNDSTKQLVLDSTPPSLPALLMGDDVRSFVIGKDGSYWITNVGAQIPPGVYRRHGSQWITVSGLSDCAPLTCSSATLAVGSDGTVYATSMGGKLYRYDTVLKRFISLGIALPGDASRLDFVGVDPSSRLWAVSGTSGKIYEYVGSAWISRNDAILSSPGTCISGSTVCFSIGANGSVYSSAIVSGIRRLLRWNATSRAWDVVSTSPSPGIYVVAPDGRPWVMEISPAKLYKAR